MTALPIHHGHALRAAVLPEHHRDPFDRMLVAQAQLEGFLQLMTEDKIVARYDVQILSGRGSGAMPPPPPEADAQDADTEDADTESTS